MWATKMSTNVTAALAHFSLDDQETVISEGRAIWKKYRVVDTRSHTRWYRLLSDNTQALGTKEKFVVN